MTTLPGNVDYGLITGRFLLAVGDSSDADRDPDAVAATGTVTFTARPTYVLNNGDASGGAVIVPRPIVCTLDPSTGVLLDPNGAEGVYLIATDDADNNPSSWTYQVKVALDGISPWSFDISVPVGSTQDIAAITPVVSSSGTTALRGPAGPGNVLTIGTVTTSLTTSDASITGDSPDQVLNLVLKQGDKGDPGPANTLTKGTVTAGAPGVADFTITGASPNQVLNLVLPQGEPGADSTVPGPEGRGVVSIVRTDGTGAPGTTDTYTVTYSDATTSTISVYNGANGAGAIATVNGDAGPNVVLTAASVGAATAAQGAKADSAVQPGSLATVATSGSYTDLTAKPTIPATPADIGAATAAQGTLADGAAQKSNNLSDLTNMVSARTNLGLGTAAGVNVGTTYNTVPLLNAAGQIASTEVVPNTIRVLEVAGAYPARPTNVTYVEWVGADDPSAQAGLSVITGDTWVKSS